MCDIKELFENQVSYFETGATQDIELRINMLTNLEQWIHDHTDLIYKALLKDLGKSEGEAYMSEVGFVLQTIHSCIKSIKKFSNKKRVRTPLHQFFSRSYIMNDPYGTVLIMAPWNYPFLLALEPLINAVAAGNTVILKPSEFSYETTQVITRMIETVFDKGHVAVVEGTSEVAEELVKLNFDYIFFTGSPKVGKAVYKAAAENLTPVTLELGGKSPVIVTDKVSADLAAKRILFGKTLNAGQTCVAPDYLFIHSSVRDTFMESTKKYINELYDGNPLASSKFGKIINKKHYERLKNLMTDQTVYVGGKFDEKSLKIEPTYIKADLESQIMKEEIFGPIMPVISYTNLDEVIRYINANPKPLALYLFSNLKEEQDKVLKECSFGGGCINDTLSHVSSPYLPFGGVGESGIGQYHGKYSMETFSHQKSIMHKTTKFDLPMRYLPNEEKNLSKIKKFLK